MGCIHPSSRTPLAPHPRPSRLALGSFPDSREPNAVDDPGQALLHSSQAAGMGLHVGTLVVGLCLLSVTASGRPPRNWPRSRVGALCAQLSALHSAAVGTWVDPLC